MMLNNLLKILLIIKLDVINDKEYYETFYSLTQVNIIGSMRRYFKTDGLFRNYPLPDTRILYGCYEFSQRIEFIQLFKSY